jgi:hypothetical protein
MQQPNKHSSGPDLVHKAPVAPGSTPSEAGKGLPLPHERDESASSVSATPDPKIAQAKRDLDAGLVDTDMRATPGLDADLRKKMVPGAGGKPPPDGH